MDWSVREGCVLYGLSLSATFRAELRRIALRSASAINGSEGGDEFLAISWARESIAAKGIVAAKAEFRSHIYINSSCANIFLIL